MNKEENIELAKQLLEKAEGYSEADEEYSAEAMWKIALKTRQVLVMNVLHQL